jgi:hypothetical protein
MAEYSTSTVKLTLGVSMMQAPRKKGLRKINAPKKD